MLVRVTTRPSTISSPLNAPMVSTRRISLRLTTDRSFGISTMEAGTRVMPHGSRRMTGRDPHEAHRAATPLELLFDLTFATSFGLAASEAASVLADGHVIAGLVGFGFASFAICWAWINFSWFSSASALRSLTSRYCQRQSEYGPKPIAPKKK